MNRPNRRPRSWTCVVHVATAVCALFLAAPLALAEYEQDFDGLNGSPDGVPLTGQDGYYTPAGTESVDFLVYAYEDNVIGIPQNPEGGSQFIAGTGPGDGVYARAQRDMVFDEGTLWKLQYDFCATFLGTGESAQNLGSFSVRSSETDNDYIHLMSWVDPLDPSTFNAFYMAYDFGGSQFAQPGESPGPGWEGLEVNHWYRAWTIVDLETNLILEVGIVDLEFMTEATYEPADWYLEGGGGGGVGPPIAFRFFAGGSVPGNTAAFDNAVIVLEAPVPVVEVTWGGLKAKFK